MAASQETTDKLGHAITIATAQNSGTYKQMSNHPIKDGIMEARQ